MRVLWDQGGTTVREVMAALPQDATPAYTTVASTLQTLEGKGVVTRERLGRAHRYYPKLSRSEARYQALRYVLARFFHNSSERLLLNLAEHDELDADTLARLQSLLEASDDESEPQGGSS